MKRRFFENAQMLFRDFSGVGTKKYPANGRRSFCIKLTDEQANEMAAEGWNVKMTKSENPDYPPEAYIKVNVSYAISAPTIYVVNGNTRTAITEETVSTLDGLNSTNIEYIDATVDGSMNPDRPKMSAYLKTLYIKYKPDPIEAKWAAFDNYGDE